MKLESTFVIISGMPASGKTTIVDFLSSQLHSKNYTLYKLHGDVIAHYSYRCQYSQKEIKLKYMNLMSAIKNMSKYKRLVLYEDFFRKIEDYNCIVATAERYWKVILHFKLLCPLTELIVRNSLRHPDHRLGRRRLLEYHKHYSQLTYEVTEEIDTNAKSISEVASIIFEYLQ